MWNKNFQFVWSTSSRLLCLQYNIPTELPFHLNDCSNEHTKKNDQGNQTKKNHPGSICKNDFTTMAQLYNHFQEKYVDGEKGSDCYFTNHKILLELKKCWEKN